MFPGATDLEQLVSAEQLAAAAHRALGQNGADVVVAAVGLQADSQAAALAELLHLSHLSQDKKQQLYFSLVCMRLFCLDTNSELNSW